MANTDQQTDAGTQRENPANSKGTPEQGYSKAEYDRVDNNRREAQRKLDALQRKYDKLTADYTDLTAQHEALDATLEKNITEETLRNEVRKLAAEKAALKKEVAAFERDKAEFDSIASKQAEENLNKMAERLISEYKVPKEKQSELREITNPDQMELYAFKNRAAIVDVPASDGGDNPAPAQDSPILPGVSAGGPRTVFTQSEIKSMDNKTYAEHHEAIIKALAEGRIKD